jgi:hypothetical protein
MLDKYVKRIELQDKEGLVLGYRAFDKHDWLTYSDYIKSNLDEIVIDICFAGFATHMVLVFDDNTKLVQTLGSSSNWLDVCDVPVAFFGNGLLNKSDTLRLSDLKVTLI